MTLTQATGVGPITNFAIAPAGGGLKDILINTGISLVETVITNYISSKTNAISKEQISNIVQSGSKTFRNVYGQRRTGKQRYKPRHFKNFGRTKVYNRRSSNYSKFRKYRR